MRLVGNQLIATADEIAKLRDGLYRALIPNGEEVATSGSREITFALPLESAIFPVGLPKDITNSYIVVGPTLKEFARSYRAPLPSASVDEVITGDRNHYNWESNHYQEGKSTTDEGLISGGINPAFEFRECDTCAAKPGTPELCGGCKHNRRLIENLKATMSSKGYATGGFTPNIDRVEYTGDNCPTCSAPQYNTLSGVTCRNGHDVLSQGAKP